MRKAILLGLVTLIFTMAQPARAQFCPGAAPWVFDDVPAGDLFCGYITWAAQNGITLGCAIIDPNHRLFCPNDAVKRSEMAAFVNRLGNVRVETVNTGPGLTGGPITGVGTINLAATQLLPTTACASGQVLQWNGSAWACAAPGGVASNIDLPNSASASVGNIVKPGGVFLHNFGASGTFLGVNAGSFVMTGQGNTGVGTSALAAISSGQSNSAMGAVALQKNTLGSFNTAIGRYTLQNNLIGNNNTAIGYSALVNTTGDLNTGLGVAVLNLNTTGVHNVALGATALQFNTTGSHNIAVGSAAGSSLNTGDYNIAIGNPGSGGDVGTIRIGDANQTRAFVAGIRGVTTGINNATMVVIDGGGQLGTLSSSRSVKDDIEDMGEASDVLMKLHPVTFRYKSHNGAGPRQYGLIAEEVADTAPELVAVGAGGEAETVYYQHLAPMLLNEYQKQRRVIEAQGREIAELRRAVEVLLARTSPEGRIASK